MATKFLKSQNGGIYKDSTGKPIAVEPERVIRDIDGSIPASTLEDISVSTGTASTNGVTYVRATMKGEVTYTDNTHDTINYCIDLPIKAGDGVTIEAQPIEGATGNKQLVISASGGSALNAYQITVPTNGSGAELTRLYNILTTAKGRVLVYENNAWTPILHYYASSSIVYIMSSDTYAYNDFPKQTGFRELLFGSGVAEKKRRFLKYVFAESTWKVTESTLTDSVLIKYFNDTEITA